LDVDQCVVAHNYADLGEHIPTVMKE